MQRILVTGSSGFVGGALGRWLREHMGAYVIGLSRSDPRPRACDEHFRHDLTQPVPIEIGPCDAVVHCAALASPWASPAAYETANIDALRQILTWSEQAQVSRFVFVSSSAVQYAWTDQLGLAEDTPWPKRPINLYAATKRRGEAMVAKSRLPWTIVRPRAVFGPGDTVVFPRILHAARKGVLPRLRRSDGVTPEIDLLYIDNLCWFIDRALRKDQGGVFNLADGAPTKVSALLDMVFSELGLPAPRLTLSLGAAMALAGAMETISSGFLGWREPPVTRFGIASLAFSKTIDTTRAVSLLGAPPVARSAAMTSFLRWQSERMRRQ